MEFSDDPHFVFPATRWNCQLFFITGESNQRETPRRSQEQTTFCSETAELFDRTSALLALESAYNFLVGGAVTRMIAQTGGCVEKIEIGLDVGVQLRCLYIEYSERS